MYTGEGRQLLYIYTVYMHTGEGRQLLYIYTVYICIQLYAKLSWEYFHNIYEKEEFR